MSGQTGADVATDVPRCTLHTVTLAKERNEKRASEGKDPRPVPEEVPWKASTVQGILRNPRYAGYTVYTSKKDRKLAPGESRRKALKHNIVRDENNEPVHGQWAAIIEPDQWWTVQNLLDDPKRVTNRSGSTVRKHLGAGLYVCDECEKPVITRGRYYSCPDGHLNRTRERIDNFVRAVVVKRLTQKDLQRKTEQTAPDSNEPFSQKIAEQRARITRAERDYDAEIIEGQDLARIRNKARDEIQRLEAERLSAGKGSMLAPILGMQDPKKAFLEATLAQQRSTIDILMSVRVKKAKQGLKRFDPHSVVIEWKS